MPPFSLKYPATPDTVLGGSLRINIQRQVTSDDFPFLFGQSVKHISKLFRPTPKTPFVVSLGQTGDPEKYLTTPIRWFSVNDIAGRVLIRRRCHNHPCGAHKTNPDDGLPKQLNA